jgi:hypothetical protein
MNNRLRVKLDLPAIAEHLAHEERRAITEQEVLQWLSDAGFTRAGDWWIVAEVDLGHLQPTEVTAVEPVEDDSPPHG